MADNRSALVVDDVPTNRILARALLAKLGWQVDEAAGGEAALTMATQRNYRLILLDISMPGMSGTETCTALRAQAGGDSLYILAYTAHAFADERAQFLAAGFDDVVVKPVNLQTISEIVGKLAP